MPKSSRSFALALMAAVVSLLAGILGGSQGIGSPLRWVQVIGLVSSGVGFGVALTAALAKRKSQPGRSAPQSSAQRKPSKGRP
jgi:hypothetical protein